MDSKQEQALAELIMRSARMIAEGKSKNEVIKHLEGEGCPTDLAQAIVNRGSEIKKEEFRKSGKTTILIGIGLLGLGTAITAGSYNAASGGGHYIITTGFFMVGAWLVIKGLWRSVAG